MKTLYLIIKKDNINNQIVFNLLKNACKTRGVKTRAIYTDGFDFSKKIRLTPKDGLYKISITPEANLIEKYLIQKEIATFYSNYLYGIGKLDNTIECSLAHEKDQLPIIPTIFSIINDPRLLKKYVKKLGGFPVIIKSTWKNHGEGVVKINSFKELIATIISLTKKGEFFIMRKFVPHKKQGRLIVLGNKVIASHENLPTIDFRSNVGTSDVRQRRAVSYDEKIHEIAIRAVKLLGYEFGGVDILFEEKTQEPYLAEVNIPCFFPTTQKMTKVDISGMMIDHLINKANKN